LRAAFNVRELKTAAASLGPDVQCHVTALAPFIVVFRSRFQRPLDASALALARDTFAHLSAQQQSNFHGLADWLRLSGYPLPCTLD